MSSERIRVRELGVAIVPFSAFAVFVFASAFFRSDLFIGWDTPAYIYSVRILEREGFLSFLQFFEYSRFPYSLILFLFDSVWPQGLFAFVRVLPTTLAFVATFLVGLVLSRWFNDDILAVFGVIFSYIWIAPYILASNLYAQLLTLVLSLLWLHYAFAPQTRLVQSLSYVTFLVASISHVYTMIFMYVVFILANITWILSHMKQGRNNKEFVARAIILGALLMIPLIASTLLGGSTRIFGPLLNPQQMGETGTRSIAGSLVFICFGGNLILIIPIALLIAFQSMMKAPLADEKLKYLFIIWWTVLALTMPIISYVWPSLLSYAERMIIITPVPMLLAIFVRKLPTYLTQPMAIRRRIENPKVSRVLSSKWSRRTLVSFVIASMFISNVNPILDNSKIYLASYISPDIANRLESLKSVVQYEEKPLFIIDSSESLIGDYADLWHNTIGAYVGPHYIYLGPMQNLAHLRRTLFSSEKSDTWSRKFFGQLEEDDILSYDSLAGRPIFLLDCLYGLKDYEKQYVDEIKDGIFLLNFGKLWTSTLQSDLERIFIEADLGSYRRVGPWYGIHREWSTSSNVLELFSNVSGEEFVSYRFYVYESNSFSVRVRYFDFAGYSIPLVLSIDNASSVGHILYEGLQTSVERKVAEMFLDDGWHEITFRLGDQGPLMVNLDYILIEQATVN